MAGLIPTLREKAWLKKQFYKLKVGLSVLVFVVGLFFFGVGFICREIGQFLMTVGVYHCPDMISKYGR
jgi:hypothetical protein